MKRCFASTPIEDSEIREIACASSLVCHKNFISCVCVSDSPEPYIASASWDCSISIHKLHSRELMVELRSPEGAIISDIATCTRNSLSDILGSFSMDGKIRIYNALDDFKIVYCFDHALRLECSVLGAVKLAYFDRPYCISGGVDRVIRVRDLNNLDEAHYELRGHSGGIKCIDISEKGVIASGSNDNNVKLWDLFTGKFCRTLRGHSLEINAVNFIKNSTWLLTGSEDNMFRVWDIANGERLRVFKGHDGATITSISSIYIPGFVPPLAIIGGTERESYISQLMNPLEVWRLDTAELVARCTGHRDEVAALATYCERSEDCIRCEVFSGGVDKLLRIWDFTPFLSNYMSELENIDDMLSLEDSSLNSGTISKLADEEDTFA